MQVNEIADLMNVGMNDLINTVLLDHLPAYRARAMLGRYGQWNEVLKYICDALRAGGQQDVAVWLEQGQHDIILSREGQEKEGIRVKVKGGTTMTESSPVADPTE